ncbi:MAG: hypothetical protein P4L73_02750, partial [Caulobacteraceae bacterium]|nr:hypothetical protein [Caulobacteraceae bacterium]
MAETLPAIDETPAGPQPAAACGSDAVARRAQVRPALRLQTLEELAGIGMDLARTLGRQATEAAETGPGA